MNYYLPTNSSIVLLAPIRSPVKSNKQVGNKALKLFKIL